MCRLSFKGGRTVKRESLHLFLKVYLFFFQSLFFPPLDKAHIAQHIWEAPDRNMILKREKGKKKKADAQTYRNKDCSVQPIHSWQVPLSPAKHQMRRRHSQVKHHPDKKKKTLPSMRLAICPNLFLSPVSNTTCSSKLNFFLQSGKYLLRFLTTLRESVCEENNKKKKKNSSGMDGWKEKGRGD